LEKDINKRFGKKLQVIGISLTDVKAAKEFKSRHGLTFPVLVDEQGSLAKVFGIQTIPTNILLDKSRKIIYREEGFDAAGLTKAISKQIAQK